MTKRRVGMRELRAGLPAFIQQAEQGHDVLVTRHGRAIVRIVAVVADNPGGDDDLTDEELREAWARVRKSRARGGAISQESLAYSLEVAVNPPRRKR